MTVNDFVMAAGPCVRGRGGVRTIAGSSRMAGPGRLLRLAILVCVAGLGGCQDGLPGLSEIREADIRRDIDVLAGDGMRGREAGTLDELRASAWIANRAREAGLEPAGDDGTYFQFWPIRRTRISDHSVVQVDGSPLTLWSDAVVMQPVEATIDGTLVDIGATPADEVTTSHIVGKPVVARLLPPDPVPDLNTLIGNVLYTWQGVAERAEALVAKGASAVIVVGDSVSERAADWIAQWQSRGSYELDAEPSAETGEPGPGAPVLLVSEELGAAMSAGSRFQAEISVDSFRYPSVNVIARVTGTAAGLADEHVLFSAHQDHDGLRYAVEGDSIWNGADDNASASVALLAIGRAFAAAPARRSALFVWHGAEEKGLLGSRWHVANPVVPREKIVAVLNADMIGRNHPDTASLLGAQPPHRNSPDLVAMALEANRATAGFVVDSLWDRPDHPEGFYFRSDHLPYARAGIPALFFTSVLHADYHTQRDEPAAIDVGKLARIARWIYATGRSVADAAVAPRLDPEFELER